MSRRERDFHIWIMDWGGREDATRIDASRCRAALLTGEYDDSCAPAMSEAVAAAVPGARLTIMRGMGHLPMIESYPAFRPHPLAAPKHVAE